MFAVITNTVAVGYEYKLFVADENNEPIELDKPYSCINEILQTYGDKTVLMTPVFQKICNYGERNETNEQCVIIQENCNPGYYLDLSQSQPTCKPCEAGYWCPERHLSVQTNNETVCGGIENIAENGKTEATRQYKWKNAGCYNTDGKFIQNK